MWKQKDADQLLVGTAVSATIFFTLLATKMNRSSPKINALFITIVSISLYLYSLRLGVNLSNLPAIFYKRIFDGTYQRFVIVHTYWAIQPSLVHSHFLVINEAKMQ